MIKYLKMGIDWKIHEESLPGVFEVLHETTLVFRGSANDLFRFLY